MRNVTLFLLASITILSAVISGTQESQISQADMAATHDFLFSHQSR